MVDPHADIAEAPDKQKDYSFFPPERGIVKKKDPGSGFSDP